MRAWNGVPSSWNLRVNPCSPEYCSLNSTTPACAWQGVACYNSRVVGIMLPNGSGQGAAGITGTLPPAISNLTQLQLLNMNGNRLTGSIPESVASMQYFAIMALTDNSLVRAVKF